MNIQVALNDIVQITCGRKQNPTNVHGPTECVQHVKHENEKPVFFMSVCRLVVHFIIVINISIKF